MNARQTGRALLLSAVLALTLAAGASANRLGFSSPTFRVLFPPGVREGFIICPMTLEGSFHSQTIRKIEEALIGYITRAHLHEALCTGGTGRFLQESLPWHLRYAAFTGALPAITSIITRAIGVSFSATTLGRTCLYVTTTETPGIAIWGREPFGAIRSFRWGENERIPPINCERTLIRNLIGMTEIVTELATTRVITVMLI
jgi:hypothetical protein